MKKNSQIHLYLDTSLLEEIKREARDNDISISEFCRKKFKPSIQLERIEKILKEINGKLKCSTKYQTGG